MFKYYGSVSRALQGPACTSYALCCLKLVSTLVRVISPLCICIVIRYIKSQAMLLLNTSAISHRTCNSMTSRTMRLIIDNLNTIEQLIDDAEEHSCDYEESRMLQRSALRIRLMRNSFETDLLAVECNHHWRRIVPSGPRDNGESYMLCIHCRDIK